MMFTQLPTEVQLQVFSQVHATQHISKQCDALIRHINSRKLHHYTSNPVTISLYSSSSKEAHKKLFYNASFCTDDSVTRLTLTDLSHKESLLQIENLKETLHTHESHLDLVLSEEQSSVKLFMTIQCSEDILLDTTVRLRDGVKSFEKNDVNVEFEMVKGDKQEKEGLYEYEESFNYSLCINKIEINNEDLVKLFEKDGCMFVRF